MVARAVEEDLRLVFEPAERAAVDDAVAVALEFGTQRVFRLGECASARVGGLLRVGREGFVLKLFQFDAVARHDWAGSVANWLFGRKYLTCARTAVIC